MWRAQQSTQLVGQAAIVKDAPRRTVCMADVSYDDEVTP